MVGVSKLDAPTLTTLPAPVLRRIAYFVLCPSAASFLLGATLSSATPTSNADAVALCRVHPTLRVAAASSIGALSFPSPSPSPWPSLRVLSPTAWPSLRVLRLSVDRSRAVGFLKFLLVADGLQVLHLHVVGAAYAAPGLGEVERLLVGRFFMQTGRSLREIDVDGLDSKSVIMAAVCRCSRLEVVRIGHYVGGAEGEEAPSGPGMLLYIFLLLCLVNRRQLKSVAYPFKDPFDVPERAELMEGVNVSWATLWGNYRAGAKEAAANLPAEAEEMHDLFKTVSVQMDEIEETMTAFLKENVVEAGSDGAREKDAGMDALLRRLLPKVTEVSSA